MLAAGDGELFAVAPLSLTQRKWKNLKTNLQEQDVTGLIRLLAEI